MPCYAEHVQLAVHYHPHAIDCACRLFQRLRAAFDQHMDFLSVELQRTTLDGTPSHTIPQLPSRYQRSHAWWGL